MRSFITVVALCCGMVALAQEPNDMLDLLRSDLRTERHAIVMSSLNLTEAERAVFMPIYEEYTAVMRTHWEARLVLVDDYTKARETLGVGQAAEFMKRLFALEREDISIREKYAQKVSKVLPTTIAARWAQIERRLGQLMELQIANEVPLVPSKP